MVVVLLGFPARVYAQGTIRYETTNLVDVVVGEDLWRYRFYLSGFNFLTNQGLSIFFDYEQYRALADATSSSLDPKWDVLVVQPDVLLTDDGFLDALARGDSPSLAVPFLVDFVWLGVGVPGALPYYTYDPNFQVLFAGTTSLVPEPRVWGLLGLGGLLWLGRRCHQTRPL